MREQLCSLLCERAELKSTVEDQRELMQLLQRDYVEYKEQAAALKDRVATLMVELEVGGRRASHMEGFSQMMQSHIMSLLNGFEETRSQLFQELRSHLQYQLEACATSIMNSNTDVHHCDDLHGSVLLNPPVPSSPSLDGFDYDEFEQDSMEDGTPSPPHRSDNRRGLSVDTTSENERFHCSSNLSGAFHFDNEFNFRDDSELSSWKSPDRSPEDSLFRKLFQSSANIDSSKTNPLFSERRKSMQLYTRRTGRDW